MRGALVLLIVGTCSLQLAKAQAAKAPGSWSQEYGPSVGIIEKDSAGHIKTIRVRDVRNDGQLRDQIERALSMATDGTEIYLPQGRYGMSGFATVRSNGIGIVGNNTTLVFPSTGENPTQPSHGFYAAHKQRLRFTGIHFIGRLRLNETGIYLRSVSYSEVTNCTFDSLGFAGIIMTSTRETAPATQVPDSGCNHNIIADNSFRNMGGIAIFLFGGARYNTVGGNVCTHASHGVVLDDATISSVGTFNSCRYNVILGNTIRDATFVAIDLEGSKSNTVTSNICDESQIGISLLNMQHGTPSDSNIVANNVISNSNQQGMVVTGSGYNLIEGNMFLRNRNYGLNIAVGDTGSHGHGSQFNYVRGNYFLGSLYAINISDMACTWNSFGENKFRGQTEAVIHDGTGGKYIWRINDEEDDTLAARPGTETAVRTIKASYSATTQDHTILCDASASRLTVTLPSARINRGKVYVVKKIDASTNIATVATYGGESIDASSSIALNNPYQRIVIQSDGSNWQRID